MTAFKRKSRYSFAVAAFFVLLYRVISESGKQCDL